MAVENFSSRWEDPTEHRLTDELIADVLDAAGCLFPIAEEGVKRGTTPAVVMHWLDNLGMQMHLLQVHRKTLQ